MSFREKNAWIAVVTGLVIWSYYFWTFATTALAGALDGDQMFWLFVWCLGISMAVMLPLNIVAAVAARQDMDAAPDERERAIDAQANRIGLAVLEVMAVGLVLSSGWISGFARETYTADPAGAAAILLVNGLLFVLAFAATLREVIQIVNFRLMD